MDNTEASGRFFNIISHFVRRNAIPNRNVNFQFPLEGGTRISSQIVESYRGLKAFILRDGEALIK